MKRNGRREWNPERAGTIREVAEVGPAMSRRRFLLGSIAAALALPVVGMGSPSIATACGRGEQSVVVVILTGEDPESGIGGWIDTAGGGRYDLSQGVVTIPGWVGQSLVATVYRDDGCIARVTLVFQPEFTLVMVGGC